MNYDPTIVFRCGAINEANTGVSITAAGRALRLVPASSSCVIAIIRKGFSSFLFLFFSTLTPDMFCFVKHTLKVRITSSSLSCFSPDSCTQCRSLGSMHLTLASDSSAKFIPLILTA